MIALDEDDGFLDDCALLTKCWINEKMSPDLLPYAQEVVSNVLELISNQVLKNKTCFLKYFL